VSPVSEEKKALARQNKIPITPESLEAYRIATYRHIHKQGHDPTWRGSRILKMPQDIVLYQEAIWENRPDVLIETGTLFGASAQMFADFLSLFGGEKVYTIDVRPQAMPKHDMVEYVVGSSSKPEIRDRIAAKVEGKKVMVVLDSNHRYRHVRRELKLWSPVVTPGQFLVVEDCWASSPNPFWPYPAVEEFLKKHPNFKREPRTDKYLAGITRDGWLKRIK
jgi:cephalosporin hydroxylase